MFSRDGGQIRPGSNYFVVGNSKVYGAALFRLCEKDFEWFRHRDGISPEWPIKYRDWEDYYSQAEELYGVHGQIGVSGWELHSTFDISAGAPPSPQSN